MKISLSILKLLCPALLMLPMATYAKKAVNQQVTIYNKTQWPLLIWPIPEKAPPYLMATVPQEQPGVITAPARLGWPGNAKAMIIVAAPKMAAFEAALKKTIEEFNRQKKPKDFKWDLFILQFAAQQGNLTYKEWGTLYPTDYGVGIEDRDKLRHILLKDQNYDLVVYDKPLIYGTSNPTKK